LANNTSDRDILILLKSHDNREKGFRLLVKTYQKRLYWHIRRMIIDHDDTDDVIQEVFIKVWMHIHKFREESNLYTWLYRIASNEALAFLKKKKKHSTSSLTGSLMQNDAFFTPDDNSRRFYESLLTLPDKQRLVFNMKYFEDLKYEEISEITGTSTGGLKASYHHAVKKIENYLKEVKPLTANNIKPK